MNGWITIDTAAQKMGYSSGQAMRRRIRALREQGFVQDLGNPPAEYPASDKQKAVRVYWANPVTMLVNENLPSELFAPRRGRRWK